MPNTRGLTTNPGGEYKALQKVIACPHCGREGQACFMGSHIRACNPGRREAMFWSKVVKREGDKCWDWAGHTRWDGYGRFRHQHKAVFAHRYSYELHHGQIPDGMSVMHTCDNPICTNPKHLRVGTHQENMDDMRAKGRAWKGGNNRRAAA